MRFVHVISGRYVRIRLSQKIGFERVTFQVDAEPFMPFINESERLCVGSVAHSRPFPRIGNAVKRIVLIGSQIAAFYPERIESYSASGIAA
jgi:hypothetical protein